MLLYGSRSRPAITHRSLPEMKETPMVGRQGELPRRLHNPPLRSPATDWVRGSIPRYSTRTATATRRCSRARSPFPITSAARAPSADRFDTAKTFNWWQRTVGSGYGKARADRDFGRVYDKAHEFRHVRSRTAQSGRSAPDILPQLERIKEVVNVRNGIERQKKNRPRPVFCRIPLGRNRNRVSVRFPYNGSRPNVSP